jgi:hypothetical protein
MAGSVCQCIADTLRTLVVQTTALPHFEIVHSYYGGLQPDSFEVIEADLDADGAREILIAVYHAHSTGLSVAYWTVYVLTPGSNSWQVDSLSVQEYSTVGSWAALPGETRCNLLHTSWVNGFEPSRGVGLYLEATWYALQYGQFVRRADRPVVRRRYLYSFERERNSNATPDAPLGWLRDHRAKPWTSQH